MQASDKISQFVTYKEATHSNTGVRQDIPNVPNETQLKAMKAVAGAIHTPMRLFFAVAIFVTSFFRSALLNKAIGGAKSSQHLNGEAMDLDMGSGMFSQVHNRLITNRDLFEYVRKYLVFDQMIWEFGDDDEPDWVHVSYVATGKNRGEILRAVRKNGKTVYEKYVEKSEYAFRL